MGSHTDYKVPSAEAIRITARKLNLLYGELSEGEFLPDTAPFFVLEGRITVTAGQEWNVATVLEKVLRKELPFTNRDRAVKAGGFGHTPQRYERDYETGKLTTVYTYGNPNKPFVGD